MFCTGQLVDEAIHFAVKAHSGMNRKGTNIPYILHPMEAGAIAAGITDNAEVIAAAILHDVMEDAGITKNELQKHFGAHVADLVAAESENKRTDIPAAEGWEMRKRESLQFLENSASRDEKIITLADKLSNIRAIHRDYMHLKEDLWLRFNQKDKSKHAWYYGTIGDLLRNELETTTQWREYNALVEKVFGNAGVYNSGNYSE